MKLKKILTGTTAKNISVRLRPLRVCRAQRCLDWVSDPEISRFIGARPDLTLKDEVSWIHSMNRSKTNLVCAIEIINQLAAWHHIGNVGVHRIDWNDSTAELGIMIGDAYSHGKGVGTLALSLIRDYAFQDLGLFKLYARVYSSNAPSMKMCEKTGLTLEGIEKQHVVRDGVRLDVHRFTVFRDMI